MNLIGRGKSRRGGRWDMTPMIDVVLQLIIFFMYASQMAQMSRTDLDLPEESGKEASPVEGGLLVIDLDASGRLLVDREVVDLARVVELVSREVESKERAGGTAKDVEILVRADRACGAGPLNSLAIRLRDLGVSSWRLGTLQPPPGRTGGGGGGGGSP